MPWQIDGAALDRVFDAWSDGKSYEDRIYLLSGLIEMADCPLTELPGFRFPERSPMWRFARIGSAVFVLFVAETHGVLIPIDIRD
ncbi:MAG: hypothetical protein OXF41_10190 [bacterium]|nr:hypothetical protein [bacterium]